MALNTPPRVDTDISLPDGRNIGCAEYGDSTGSTVFLFHGLPGSRLAWGFLPINPFPSGLRVIALDRPGYGRSTPNPGRSLLDWADDVKVVADHLSIETFAIVGVSGGGPGALACAWKMPERVMAVGVVSSPTPTDAPGVLAGMSSINRFFMRLAWRVPWLSSLNVRMLAALIRRSPERYINSMKYKVHEVDKATVAKPEICGMLVNDFNEALQGGAQGMVDDMNANHGQPWGFALDEIKSRVYIWSCLEDLSVPPAMGLYLDKTIPNSETEFVENAGHLWVLEHMNDVLGKVMFTNYSE